MKPVTIYIRPLNQSTNQRIDLRIADGATADDYAVAGFEWKPAVGSRPRLSIELMSPQLDGNVQAGEARFDVLLRACGLPKWEDIYWGGASVVIHCSGIMEGATAVPDFWGYITDARPDLDTGRLAVTARVSTILFDRPLLTKEFTGGGGALGEPEKRGTLYPAGFGKVRNLEPVWFDTVRNIGMVEGYGNTISLDWLGEGRSSFGPPVAVYASHTALQTAVDTKQIPPGRWAGAIVPNGPSYVALGAPPVGIITVDATFGAARIGAMIQRILLTHAKVPADRLDTTAFDAIDQQLPYPVHFWTADQRQVRDLVQALAQSCNATPLVSFQNQVTITRAVQGAPVAVLDRAGGAQPRVLDWKSADSDPPYSRLRARTARPAKVLTLDQVNYVDTLEDKGVYAATTVYRAGNLVWLDDGSQWLYQNATPSAGHAPPKDAPPDQNGQVSDAYWQRRQPPRPDIKLEYEDGTPIEALKPATPNATEGAPGMTPIGGTLKPDGSIEGSLPAQELVDTAKNTSVNLAKEELRGAQWRALRDLVLYSADGRNVLQLMTELAFITADHTAYIQEQRSVDDQGFARASVLIRGDGGVAGWAGEAGNGRGRFYITANEFGLIPPGGSADDPVKPIEFRDGIGYIDNLVVRLLQVDSVTSANLQKSSVSQAVPQLLSSNVSCPYNAWQVVFTMQFEKHEASSMLEIFAYMSVRHPDDLIFSYEIRVDGVATAPAAPVKMSFDNSNSDAKMPITPFGFVDNLSAGTHTVQVLIRNEDTEGPLTVFAGSALKVTELKKASM